MTDVATKMGAGYSKKINGVNSISLDEFGLFSRIIDFNGTHSLKADKLPVSCLPRKNRNRHRVKSLGISRIIDSYGWHKKSSGKCDFCGKHFLSSLNLPINLINALANNEQMSTVNQ